MKKKSLFISIAALLAITGCTKYNGLPPEEAEHVHTYAETYSNDENQHWFASTCEHSDQRKAVENHTFGEYVVSQEATLTANGTKVRTCSICGYKEETIINKLTDVTPDNPNPTGTITDISVDRDSIEMTVGDNPVSVTANILGEGELPTSLTVICDDMSIKKIVDEEEVTENVKVAQISSSVVESGKAFSVSAVAAGTTKITIYSASKPEIKKEIEVKVNAKQENHSISLEEASLEMYNGATRVLLCNSTDNVTWSCNNETAISLENKTNTGVWLKGKAITSEPVTITATICVGTSYETSATCQVSVVPNPVNVFTCYFINNEKISDLALFTWDGNHNNNADWPGVELGTADYINKDRLEVYKITIDTSVYEYKNFIISGKDIDGNDFQTVDIPMTSFAVQNAFTISSMSGASEGTNKGNIKLSSFNPSTDVLEDENYLMLSMDEVSLFAGNSINVNTYSSADLVEYDVISGTDVVELKNASKDGFTITALKGGTASVSAKITTPKGDKTALLTIEVVEDELLTYYFTNNYLWTDLKVFFWNDATERHNATFPGVDLTTKAYVDEDGKDVYLIQCYKLADNWQGFIISGKDEYREGMCQTVNINFEDFGTYNNVKMDDWEEGKENVAKVKFGDFSNKLYINVSGNTTMQNGTSSYLTVTTNADEVTYTKNSGASYINLSEESNKGVKITGLAPGTASIKISVGEGDDKVTKTISIKVINDKLLTYYFRNEYEWKDVKVFLFNGGTHENNGNFPGESMTLVSTDNGKEIYSVSFMEIQDGYNNIIFSGQDDLRGGRVQTEDIPISDLQSDSSCVSIIGWNDNGKAKHDILTIGDYLNLDKESKTIKIGDTWKLNFESNKEVTFENENDAVINVSKEKGYLSVTGLETGTSVISVTVGDGDNKITKTCTVTVAESEPEPETYTYVVNNLPSGYGNDSPKLFAWIWGSGVTSQWVECQIVNGNIQFESTYENITGCKILRYRPEFNGTPNFDHTGDDGLWNKSGNIPINNKVGDYGGNW